MLEFNKLQSGNIISEASYFTVKEVNRDSIIATDGHGNDVRLGKQYLEKIITSAEQFDTEEKINQTEMIKMILTNPRTAMSIEFKKQDKVKTKKAYTAEKLAKVQEISNAKVSDIEVLLSDLIDNPITMFVLGEMRLIKGYHYGTQDERGRINFVDMEDKNISKVVDPRTVSYVIVNNVKYTLK